MGGCVRECVGVYVSMGCVHVSVNVQVCVYKHVCVYISWVCTCMSVCSCVYMSTCVCIKSPQYLNGQNVETTAPEGSPILKTQPLSV